jgi:hypothetical protein
MLALFSIFYSNILLNWREYLRPPHASFITAYKYWKLHVVLFFCYYYSYRKEFIDLYILKYIIIVYYYYFTKLVLRGTLFISTIRFCWTDESLFSNTLKFLAWYFFSQKLKLGLLHRYPKGRAF